MKIIFFTEGYVRGGVVSFLVNLVNNWPEPSDQLVLICSRHDPGASEFGSKITRRFELVKHDIATFIYFFNDGQGKNLFDSVMRFVLKSFSFVLRYLFLVYNIFSLRRLLLEVKADRLMVVYGGYPNGDSCRAATIAWGLWVKKPKSILNLHGTAVKAPWRIHFQELAVDFFVSRYTEKIVSVSKACAGTMSRRSFFKKHKVSYIYNGIEADKQSQTGDIKAEIGIASFSPLCVSMGTFDKNKGHLFLLQAFKRALEEVPDAHLLICGDGSDRQIGRLRSLASELKVADRVHVEGFRADPGNILRQADILLCASQFFESFGLTCVEAMAQGVPVIATDVGALPEIVVSGENGYCIDKNDIAAFSGAIIRLLRDAALRKELGKKSFARYSRFFSAFRMAREYQRIVSN